MSWFSRSSVNPTRTSQGWFISLLYTKNNLQGARMKWFWGVGKALTVVFWWVVLLNLFMPMVNPFHQLINAAGAALLLIHVLEVLLFNRSLRGRSHRWFDRLQILLVGIFHVQSIRAPVEGSRHA